MPELDPNIAFPIAALIFLIGFPLFHILFLVARRRTKRLGRELDQEKTRASEDRDRILAEEKEKRQAIKQKYSPIIDMEGEVGRLKAESEELARNIDDLRSSYASKRETMKKLEHQVAVYDERLAFAELGVYEPHFDFGESEIFKEQIKQIREQQKAMVSQKTAAICPTDWTVDGSLSKGQTMINRQMRLTMRAFNNECEAAIANTRWNNVVAMEKRILNAAKQINSANASMNLSINERYVSRKLNELLLTHEHREQLKVEKDDWAERARMEREEKKLLAEAKAAEKEKRKYQDMLDKARQEAGVDESRIADLQAALAEAHAKTERAKAMAEMTKSGYVYIISNIGSFGEEVDKIGLTRRLDPDDREKELGDASVQFGFDTHAMIYSEEAPALEKALHREFADRRINASNMRKEFFRVGLEEVEDAVKRLAPDANFFKDREVQEWHETLARRKEQAELWRQATEEALPETI
ncbi:DUF4041 domain-containing protein [Sagittula sp. NFXS13]|uniref:DUF4041 domain-containing protein n=1 Tax=Sagittula sp. NFXS13 TaxID=2819095 RepID=UPI0032DE905D